MRTARIARAGAAVAALAAAGALAAPAAHAKRVRVFAAGPRTDLSWMDTRQHYHDKLFALIDRAHRVPGAPAVQAGAGDVAGELLGPADPAQPVQTARDLVTLPEDIGLFAALTGQRGAQARGESSFTNAVLDLLASYLPVETYYGSRFPELGQRPFPPTRLLLTSLTDTFGHVAVETFAEIAATYHVYLEAGVDMVQDWHIVCTSKATYQAPPGGEPCAEENPQKVAQLRPPDDPSRTYVYEATSPKPSNMALVFDPSGKLISKQVKTYLTPVELAGNLDLVPGAVSTGLSALPTPVGTLGFVTSKDAWMPDVTARLDEEHVQLLVQPEYFVGDTVRTTGPWAPDNIQGAGYSDVLRHPSIDALVLPETTGNIYEYSADNQQAIVLKPRSTRRPPLGSLVGQPLAPGYAQVSPWIVKDPIAPGEPFPARRKRLGEAGEKLLPDGPGPPCTDPSVPGPCKGGQVEGVIFQDVQVDQSRIYHPQRPRRRSPRLAFTRNRPIDPSRSPQRNVALAAQGRSVVAAFEERRTFGARARDQVLLVRSRDDGAHWSPPVRPTGRAAGAADEWWPSAAVVPGGRTVWIAWQDDSSGTQRVYFARSSDGGRTFGPARPVDGSPAPDVHQWRPSIAATGPDTAVVAWVDERSRFASDDLPQAGIWAARITGDAVGPATRVDSTAAPAPLAATLDNAWAPSVAARGSDVLVAWLDFRNYDWDVFARRSSDGGATFGAEQPVNDEPAGVESLEDSPSAALGREGPLVAFTDWAKDDSSATTPSRLYDTDAAIPGGTRHQVDQHGAAHVETFSPSLLALPDGDALVAWQDMARGPGDIYVRRVGSDGAPAGRAQRVDDTGTAGWNQWRPALALTARRVVAAWEDERDGPAQIYAARARAARLR